MYYLNHPIFQALRPVSLVGRLCSNEWRLAISAIIEIDKEFIALILFALFQMHSFIVIYNKLWSQR